MVKRMFTGVPLEYAHAFNDIRNKIRAVKTELAEGKITEAQYKEKRLEIHQEAIKMHEQYWRVIPENRS